MRTIYIGVSHDNNLRVAQLLNSEVLLSDSGSKRRNDVNNLVVLEDFIEPRLGDVYSLAP